MMFLMHYLTNLQSFLLIKGVHDSDEARQLRGHKEWLRGLDYATVLSGAQIESEAVRDIEVETSVVEIARGVPENPSSPDDEGE